MCVAGCASYPAPGGPARLDALSPNNPSESEQAASRFPARIAIARVQSADYQSFSARGHGKGAFTVVDAQELLSAEQIQHFSAWPSASEPVVIAVPEPSERFESIKALRMAAAIRQADVLLSYTVDTAFEINGRKFSPASKIPLDLGAKADAAIAVAASAVFIDVRSGFVYGLVEASAQAADLAAAWASPAAIDQKRLSIERQAIAQLLLKAEATWADIASRYR